jgi:hypothetical protein
VIDDPNGVQKAYEKNLKQYRQENPIKRAWLTMPRAGHKVTGDK